MTSDSSHGQTILSDDARVSVITVQPGEPVYTLFGHTAIRIYDPQLGLDRSYNYGTFDYADPLFVPRFIQGDLNYYLSVGPSIAAIRHYSEVEQRMVIEQVLNLDREGRQKVFEFLVANARPESREYRYDFLYDNCSTRVLDALDSTLTLSVPAASPDKSFREMLAPYLMSRRTVKAGIDLSLGSEVDTQVSSRQQAFLPDALMEMLDSTTIVINGNELPLVARTDTLAAPLQSSASVPWLMYAGWILLLGRIAFLTVKKYWTRGSMIFDTTWFAITGLAGLILCYMWFFTAHTVTAWNINLLWSAPTHLFFVLYRVWTRNPSAIKKWYPVAALAAGGFFLAGSIAGPFLSADVLPWMLLTMTSAARFLIRSVRTAHVFAAD